MSDIVGLCVMLHLCSGLMVTFDFEIELCLALVYPLLSSREAVIACMKKRWLLLASDSNDDEESY